MVNVDSAMIVTGAQIAVPDAADHELIIQWTNGPHKIELKADMSESTFEIVSTRLEPPHHMKSVKYTLDEELKPGQELKTDHERPAKAVRKTAFKDA